MKRLEQHVSAFGKRHNRTRSRRATILLLVVSLLALLFVIVTGFLNLSRVNQAVVSTIAEADVTGAISDEMNSWAASLIKN